MAYLQGVVRKLAESPASFQAEIGKNGRFLVQNLYKIRTFVRILGANHEPP
jgi:hypothetical protein